jgi:hypothetical protein
MTYESQIATVLRLLSKFGGDVEISRTVQSPADPDTPWIAGDTTTVTETVKGVLLPTSKSAKYRADKDLIEETNVLYIEGGTIMTIGDSITVNGNLYKVMAYDNLEPNGERVLTTLWLYR